MFPVLVENEPLRVLLRNLREYILVRLIFALAVFHAQGQPPQLHQDSLLVKVIRHLLDGIAGKGIRARIPVTVSVEPTIIERRPLDAQFLELRYRAQHLRWGDVEFITPAAPADVMSFARRLGNLPSLFLQHTRP